MAAADPPADRPCIWLLIEIAPRIGHRLTIGAFTSADGAEAARARSPQTLSMCRIPLDQMPQRF